MDGWLRPVETAFEVLVRVEREDVEEWVVLRVRGKGRCMWTDDSDVDAKQTERPRYHDYRIGNTTAVDLCELKSIFSGVHL
jgi:hypothetical protein